MDGVGGDQRARIVTRTHRAAEERARAGRHLHGAADAGTSRTASCGGSDRAAAGASLWQLRRPLRQHSGLLGPHPVLRLVAMCVLP